MITLIDAINKTIRKSFLIFLILFLVSAVILFLIISIYSRSSIKSLEYSLISKSRELYFNTMISDISSVMQDRAKDLELLLASAETSILLSVENIERIMEKRGSLERPYDNGDLLTAGKNGAYFSDKHDTVINPDHYGIVTADENKNERLNYLADQLFPTLKSIYNLHDSILWVYIGFEDDGGLIGAPTGEIEIIPSQYDARNRTWYKNAKKNRGDFIWNTPFFETGASKLVLTGSTTINNSHGKLIGVVAVDISVDHLFKQWDISPVYKGINIAVVGDDGTIYVHKKYLEYERRWDVAVPILTLNDITEYRELGNLNLSQLDIAQNKRIETDTWTGYIITKPIRRLGWTLLVTAPDDILISKAKQAIGLIRENIHRILISVLACIFILALLLIILFMLLSRTTSKRLNAKLKLALLPVNKLATNLQNYNIDELDALNISNKEHNVTEFAVLYSAFSDFIHRLQNAQQRIAESIASTTIGRAASTIAHDMRTPISNIKACTDVLSRKRLSEYELKPLLDIVNRSVVKMLNMINDMLDYSKARTIDKSVVNIKEIVKQAEEEIIIQAKEKNVVMSYNVAPLFAKVDAKKINRVLINIIANSIEASSEGGRIVINVYECDNYDLNIIVRDTGRGINKNNLNSIFKELFSFGKPNGTGLGLSYCKQVVEAHGGIIEVDSIEGKFTEIKIIIPKAIIKDT